MSVLLFDDNDDNAEKFSLKKEGRSIKIDEEKIFQTEDCRLERNFSLMKIFREWSLVTCIIYAAYVRYETKCAFK